MKKKLITLIVLIAFGSCQPLAQAQKASESLSAEERARVQKQIDELKDSKLKDAQSANQNTKNDALKQGAAIDKKVDQASKVIDKAVENYGPRYGTGVSRGLGDLKMQEVNARAAAEKNKIASEARKKGAARTEAAKKSASDIEKSVAGLKSQVSKSGDFGLKPKGSSIYVRNYGGSGK